MIGHIAQLVRALKPPEGFRRVKLDEDMYIRVGVPADTFTAKRVATLVMLLEMDFFLVLCPRQRRAEKERRSIFYRSEISELAGRGGVDVEARRLRAVAGIRAAESVWDLGRLLSGGKDPRGQDLAFKVRLEEQLDKTTAMTFDFGYAKASADKQYLCLWIQLCVRIVELGKGAQHRYEDKVRHIMEIVNSDSSAENKVQSMFQCLELADDGGYWKT